MRPLPIVFVAAASCGLLACASASDETEPVVADEGGGLGGDELDAADVAEPLDATNADEPLDATGPDEPPGGPWEAQGWGVDQCAPPIDGLETGYATVNQLASLILKDCDGNPVDLLETCGAKGTWIFLAHGWCPDCILTSSFQEALHDEHASYGLASINVLVQSGSTYGPPTAEECHAWRAKGGHEDVVTLYDDSQASTVLWESSYTALNVFLDDQQIIKAKLHSDDEAQIEQNLKNVLLD